MDGHDFEFKEFEVSESIRLTFHGVDFVFGSLERV